MSDFRRRLMMLSKEKPLPKCLCFTALEDGTFTLTIGSNVTVANYSYVEYSIDKGKTWTRTSNVASTQIVVTTPTIKEGDSVFWRGSGLRMCNSNSAYNSQSSVFSSTGRFNASGILMSLLAGGNVTEDTLVSYNYAFSRLFNGCTNIVDASDLVMPKNTKNNCFDYFFLNCTGLLYPPKVMPSTGMTNYCMRQFFYGCTAMLEAPELKAATLATGCYYQMFQNCKQIRYMKMLATNVSATNCLYNWVNSMTNTSAFVFVKHIDATWTTNGNSGTLSNWTIIYYNPSTDKYYLSDKNTECDDHGNVIN